MALVAGYAVGFALLVDKGPGEEILVVDAV
jgi:hypothetical protein